MWITIVKQLKCCFWFWIWWIFFFDYNDLRFFLITRIVSGAVLAMAKLSGNYTFILDYEKMILKSAISPGAKWCALLNATANFNNKRNIKNQLDQLVACTSFSTNASEVS